MAGSRKITNLNKSPHHLLHRAAQFAADLYAEEVGSKRVTHRQFTVLLAVDQNDGASQTQLVRITGIDRSTLADLVRRMTESGHLQRKRTKDDGRTNMVHLTAAGRRALHIAQPGAQSADRRLMRVFSADHRKTFIAMLAELNKAVSDHENDVVDVRSAKKKKKS